MLESPDFWKLANAAQILYRALNKPSPPDFGMQTLQSHTPTKSPWRIQELLNPNSGLILILWYTTLYDNIIWYSIVAPPILGSDSPLVWINRAILGGSTTFWILISLSVWILVLRALLGGYICFASSHGSGKETRLMAS